MGTALARHFRNLVQRNRIFHVRRGIPLDLRPRFQRRGITCSLRTSELHLAGIRAREPYQAAESLFEESWHNPMLTRLSGSSIRPAVAIRP